MVGGDHKQLIWYHVGCVLNNKSYKDLNPEEFKGFEQLKDDDRKSLKAEFAEVKAAKPTRKKRQSEECESEVSVQKKPQTSPHSDDCEVVTAEETPAKDPRPVRRKPGMSQEQFQTYLSLLEEYSTKSPDELRTELRNNHQKTLGGKKALVERCAEGKLLGALPVCKQCGKGYPELEPKGKGYVCKGYREHGEWFSCGSFTKMDDLDRSEWQG